MSIEAVNWALKQRTGSPAAKLVLIVLANRAHPMTGECFPGIDGIAGQTELSRRSVINHIAALETAGLLSIQRRGGEGEGRKSNVYRLHMQYADAAHSGNVQILHGANDAGQCADFAGQCAAPAPEPKDKPKKNPKSSGRATRIPDDFELTPERRAVAEAEQVPVERTFAAFRDYWHAASGQRARKCDWDATWRNWCRTEADRSRGGKGAARPRQTRYDELMGGLE